MGFVQEAVDAGAQVVGVNCCTPDEAVAFLDAIQDIDAIRDRRVLLSAMPNVGSFQRISHRYMTQVNPEYMGKLGRGLSDRGVQLIGGDVESSHHT